MFPVASGVDAGGIGQGLQAGDFFRGKDGIHHLGGLQNMTLFGCADDGHRSLGEGPGDTDLRAGKAILGPDFRHGIGKGCQLAQNGIVLLSTVTTLRKRILNVVFPGKGALFKDHVGPEPDTILFAVIQHAAFLGRAVQQAEVILHGTYLEAGFTQDFIGAVDFLAIVVGNAHLPGVQRSTSIGL